MDAKKYEVSVPRAGMNKSTDYRNLEATEYTHASNVNIESVDGDYIDATYEKSNILSVNFPPGYKVIGRVNRLTNNYTYYFLTNPQTKKSLFGYVDNSKQYEDREDFGESLQPPLETIQQRPYNNFITLIDDSCLGEGQGFNFHIDYPILNIVLKEEKTGAEIYFTDYRNPSRYIKIDDIQYYFIDEVPCQDDVNTFCPNMDKMRIHTLYKLPEIKDVVLNTGGSLSKGSYVFLLALTDSQGNEISEYTSITQPVDVFSQDENTNKAIRLTIESLDETFSHYKVVVLHRQHLDAVMTPYEVGVYSSNTKEVVISSLDALQRTSLERLSYQNQKVNRSEGLTVVNNSLLEYGIEFQKEINLQPIANILGSYLEWQTHATTEDIYNKGDFRSKYLGINRNEIVPYSIRFLIEGGTKTALFPLVGREATLGEKSFVSANSRDRMSIDSVLDCNTSNRTQRWQYYNTAGVTSTQSGAQNTTVYYDNITNCVNNNVAQVGGGTYYFSPDDGFFDLNSYINQNISNCTGKLQEMGICQAMNNTYPDANCNLPTEEGCTTPVKIGSENFIASINNEVIEEALDTNLGSYQYQVTPQPFNPYKKPYTLTSYGLYNRGFDPENNVTSNEGAYLVTNVPSHFFYVSEIPFNCDDENVIVTEFFESPDNLQGGLFQNYILTVSKWFKLPTELNKAVFIGAEVNDLTGDEPLPEPETFVFNNTRRLSFFAPNNPVAVHSLIYQANVGTKFLVYREDSIVKLKYGNTVVDLGGMEYIYFTVENPKTNISGNNCIMQPSWGGYTVHTIDMASDGLKLTYDSITIGARLTYSSTCSTQEVVIGNCNVQPYQRGSFAYWESEATYPDNPTLFDSTKLVIKDSTLKPSLRGSFLSRFTSGGMIGDSYRIKNSFNLTCKPIRHFKFPDNKVSPFMTSTKSAPFSEATIYPLGVTINEEAVNMMLDIAVDSELITKEIRDNIYGYEIFRGDLSVNRSVFTSGLLYDLREYQESYKTVYYPNYPYNTFRDDVMNNIGHKSYGSLFTFHSPETDYSTQTNLPTEINIQGYQFGQSSGYFDEVEDHPKWTILSGKAYSTASKLATMEVTFNIARDTANVWANWNFFILGGLGSTGASGPAGQIAAMAIYIVSGTLLGLVFDYGRIRMQWQETFKNLGKGYNFASYYFSTGNYNYMLPLQSEGDFVRGTQSIKNIKDGRYEITNRIGKNAVTVNNIDREWSVFIDLGEGNKINYPSQYTSYDTRSLTFQSENGIATSGRSREIVSNIASPYVQLVNYNPTLHGTIDSVVWLSTSYRGDLRQPRTDILPIFGGDTYITRHTLKRKMPLFLTTAMGQSMTTPFEYKFYNNIGTNPRFYINHDISTDFNNGGRFFPEIRSEIQADNTTEDKFYVTSPTKFYLYYYGVPSFLVETRINTNYREYGRTPSENFYPEVGDVGRWTQENTVPIRTPNFFKYSNTYSNQTPRFNSRVLGTSFTQKLQDVVENTTNGVIISLPDVNENSTINPWLRFRPLDFHEFESKYGKLTELKGIENEAILARFENTAIIYNKVDTNVDDGNQTTAFLGGTSVFQRRTTSFVNSELGYGGSKHKESLSCEFGHFYADLDRGQIIQIPSGGGNMIEISNVNQFNKPTNMKDWFKRNLPLKLLKSNIEGINKFNPDNTFNKVGITFGYDSLHKRILITKKDYVPVAECPMFYDEETGFFTNGCLPPTISCEKGFTYDPATNTCVRETVRPMCGPGYTYDADQGLCVPNGSGGTTNYDGADIVFIMDNGGVSNDTGSVYTEIKNGILAAMSTGVIENEFNDNVRYAIVKTNHLKSRGVRYLNLAGFDTDKPYKYDRINGTPPDYYAINDEAVDLYYADPSFYSPKDLAIKGTINNEGEKSINTLAENLNKIGEFRQGDNIAKLIILVGGGRNGRGEELYDEVEEYYYTRFGTQQGAEYIDEIRDLAINKGIQIITINTWITNPPEGSFNVPTPENDYTYEGTYFAHQVITNECNFFYTVRGFDVFGKIREAIDIVKNPGECARPTKPICECSVEGSNCVCVEYRTPIIDENRIYADLNNPEFFKEVSWTIAYHPQFGMFTSFHDYFPNYYVNHQNHFSSGRNDLGSLWSHNVTNKSFGVFYGTKHPMEIETLTKSTDGAYLGTVSLFTEAKRYYDNQDFYINRDLTFNRSIIYNKRHCSGELTMDLVTGGTRFLSRYPINVSDTEQRIPITKTENRFNYSYFYDRTIRDKNLPFIKNDDNQIKIEVSNVSFNQGKGQLPRIFGDFFLNRLYYDTDSRFAMTLKLQKSLTNMHMKE